MKIFSGKPHLNLFKNVYLNSNSTHNNTYLYLFSIRVKKLYDLMLYFDDITKLIKL